MHEDKREVITREMLLKKFNRGAYFNFPIYGVAGVVTAIVFAIFASKLVEELAKEPADQAEGFMAFCGAVMLALAVVFGYLIYKTVTLIRAVKNEDGSQVIIERAKFISYVEFDPWRSLMDHGYDVVSFEGGKEYRIYHDKRNGSSCPSRLSVWLQLSEYGDTYIIVTMKNDPQTVVDLYSEKFFIYRE